MTGREVIVIATTADEDRYRQDFLDCLCYPAGHIARFSYRARWIGSGILKETIPEGGLPALVVFCEKRSEVEFDFIPVRHAAIEGFEPKGIVESGLQDDQQIVSIRFRLGDYVHPMREGMKPRFDDWNNRLGQLRERPRPKKGAKAHGESRFVFKAAGFEDGRHSEAEELQWRAVCDRLFLASSLQGCAFFRVSAVRPAVLRKRDPQTLLGKYSDKPAYLLESGRSYHLAMDQYLGPKLTEPVRTMAPLVSGELVKVSQPLRDSIGSQSHSLVILNCSRLFFTETATLVIESPSDRKSRTPRAQMVLVLKPEKGSLVLGVAALTVGALAAGVSPELLEGMPGWLGGDPLASAALFKVIGGALVAIGGFLGFRKIPGQG